MPYCFIYTLLLLFLFQPINSDPVLSTARKKRNKKKSRIKTSSVFSERQKRSDYTLLANKKLAVVSLLCNKAVPDYLYLWETQIYKNTPINTSIILITVDDVEETSKKKLKHTTIVKVPVIENPFAKRNKADPYSIFKWCRYSKINAFNLIEFDKVVMIDLDVLVVRDIRYKIII